MRRASDPLQAEADRLRSSGRWKRLRRLKLSRSPLCERCERFGETVAAVDVDHVVPVVTLLGCGQRERAFSLDACQSLCRSCHNAKTSAETAARARGVSARDVDAMTRVLANVENLPLEEACRRIEAALGEGKSHLEIPHES